jgi:hypothetical protein
MMLASIQKMWYKREPQGRESEVGVEIVTKKEFNRRKLVLEEKVNPSMMKRNITVKSEERLEANSKWVDDSQKKVSFALHHTKLNC